MIVWVVFARVFAGKLDHASLSLDHASLSRATTRRSAVWSG
jgi:hypothetical protein